MPSARRVAQRSLQAATALPTAEDFHVASAQAEKTLKAAMPAIIGWGQSATKYVYSDRYPNYQSSKYTPVPNSGLWRVQFGSGGYSSVSPSETIPFQIAWDLGRKTFQATSFKVALKFTNIGRMIAWLGNPAKVTGFIKKGLNTIDPGDAAYYAGKMTPEAIVNRVLSVTADFEVVDEWHMTSLTITLMLRTAKKVPAKLIEQWIKDNWKQVQDAAPSKTPPPAGYPSRYASTDENGDYIYDDEEDDEYGEEDNDDWMMDQPLEGLGWLAPNRMAWSEVEDTTVRFDGRRAIVSLHGSIR